MTNQIVIQPSEGTQKDFVANDWLAEYHENGQTFDDFFQSEHNIPDEIRNIIFKCVMNGSNHLQEYDSRPLSLCPVCLRKLQSSIGFDVVARYHRLQQFYRNVGFIFEYQGGNYQLT